MCSGRCFLFEAVLIPSLFSDFIIASCIGVIKLDEFAKCNYHIYLGAGLTS
jgi:hypothetical protein